MPETRLHEKELFYDTIAETFDTVVNRYDLNRRLEVVFTEFLSPRELNGRTVLDVGCGTGWFSQRACEVGGHVVSLDIGPRLLGKVREKCPAQLVAADAGVLPFPPSTFDVVISSECIEHTVDPMRALGEMARVVKPGGTLVVTVPNRLWRFSATVANALGLRPYDGLENWVSWGELKRELRAGGMEILSMIGFHLFPPVIRATWPLLRVTNRLGGVVGPLMLNIAVKAEKREAAR